MGLISRQYTGSDNIQGLVVCDGATAGTCEVCTDNTTEPLGIVVDVGPNGLANIAAKGEKAFAVVGASIAADAASDVCVNSDGQIISCNPATAESSQWVHGRLVRYSGTETYAAGDLCEVIFDPYYLIVPA